MNRHWIFHHFSFAIVHNLATLRDVCFLSDSAKLFLTSEIDVLMDETGEALNFLCSVSKYSIMDPKQPNIT